MQDELTKDEEIAQTLEEWLEFSLLNPAPGDLAERTEDLVLELRGK